MGRSRCCAAPPTGQRRAPRSPVRSRGGSTSAGARSEGGCTARSEGAAGSRRPVSGCLRSAPTRTPHTVSGALPKGVRLVFLMARHEARLRPPVGATPLPRWTLPKDATGAGLDPFTNETAMVKPAYMLSTPEVLVVYTAQPDGSLARELLTGGAGGLMCARAQCEPARAAHARAHGVARQWRGGGGGEGGLRSTYTRRDGRVQRAVCGSAPQPVCPACATQVHARGEPARAPLRLDEPGDCRGA